MSTPCWETITHDDGTVVHVHHPELEGGSAQATFDPTNDYYSCAHDHTFTVGDGNDLLLDGKGKAAAVQFAVLENKPKGVSASDFFVVR